MFNFQETEEEFVKFERKLVLVSELGQSLQDRLAAGEDDGGGGGGGGGGTVEERTEALQDR